MAQMKIFVLAALLIFVDSLLLHYQVRWWTPVLDWELHMWLG